MNLYPGSWTDAFSFFRRKHKKPSDAPPDGLPAGTVPESRLKFAVVNTALVPVDPRADKTSSRASVKGMLAAGKSAQKFASLSMGSSMPSLDQVIAKVRDLFDPYRLSFPSPPGLPDPLLSMISVTERSVGIGQRIGNETIGPFGVMALKGIRLEVVMRFLLFANSINDVDQAIQNLISNLLADRDVLRAQGVLRLSLKSVSVSESPANNQSRQSADFMVLYEEPFADNDGAQSLIAQIPIGIDSEYDETAIITDEMARWDDIDNLDAPSAPPLVVRGPLRIADLAALFHFEAGNEPTGTVTVRRTFDGAAGPPSNHPDFNAFLAEITDPVNPDRNAEFVFNSPTEFLDQFTDEGNPIELNEDTTLVSYRLKTLKIDPPINLSIFADRFEIVYQFTKFDQPAVLYLRAAHPITT